MIAHAVPLSSWLCVAPVLLGLVGACLLLALRTLPRVSAAVCFSFLVAMFIANAALLARVVSDGPVSITMGNWLPPFGIAFTADATGAGFALMAAFVSWAAVVALIGSAPRTATANGLYSLILLLVAGVSGAFLTGDIFNLYVWFEVMLIASFGLMVLGGRPLHLDAAVKYGAINIVATTLLLVGVGLLYGLLGTLNFADIVNKAPGANPALLAAVGALLCFALATKAAAFPLNAWLPASYHTPPAPVAALMAGLLTKVAAYALLRVLLMVLPAARADLALPITIVAVATALIGPLSAIGETGLRRALGFLLIGGIGVALLSLSDPLASAVAGSVAYLLVSILTYAALYLIAGLVEAVTGEGDSRHMGGLYSQHTGLSILFFVTMLSAAGIPPLAGFWPKLLLLQGFLGAGNLTLALVVIANALLSLIAVGRLWSRIFWRPVDAPSAGITKAGGTFGGFAGAALLSASVVVVGILPAPLVGLAQLAAHDLLDPSRYIAATALVP
ncbi:MAG: proton-conducting transporter membrane subunit [Devosia sp.]